MSNKVESSAAAPPASRGFSPQSIAVVLVVVLVGAAAAWATGQDGAVVDVPGLGEIRVLGLCAAWAFGLQWIVFVPSFIARTEHYYDLTGGVTYLSVVALAVALTPEQTALTWGVGVAVAIWALRLSSFLFRRVKRAGSDSRFDEMKHNAGRFLVAWTLQGLWVLLTALAALTLITHPAQAQFGALSIVGGAVWLFGFAFEVVADRQKSAFRERRERGDTEHDFITTGLWSWSRHPNYFGEIVLWTGVALVALPGLAGWSYVALVSPVFVTFLLVKVSGVPLLEDKADAQYGDNPDYQAYKRRTPVLVPRPPRN